METYQISLVLSCMPRLFYVHSLEAFTDHFLPLPCFQVTTNYVTVEDAVFVKQFGSGFVSLRVSSVRMLLA